jgi:HME family heavy-metal exporter
VIRDIRGRLAQLPAAVSVGQPISHRLDHLLSGVRAQIAIKVFGDDLDTLRAHAEDLRERLAAIEGVTDLAIEKQVLIPQLRIEVDHAAAARYGVPPGALLETLERAIGGERIAQVIEGSRRFDLVLRMPDAARDTSAIGTLLIETPLGRVPLEKLARVVESDGPNQISRDNGRRRIVVSANTAGRELSAVVADIRAELAARPLPEGYFYALEGQFQAQEEAQSRIAWLALVSVGLIYLVLYARYRSAVLALMIMGNIPLALVGAVVALWLSGQPLSVAALIGFITLAGISTRNGILKVSHYINLCAFEGERFGREMIVRGSLERLTPVLMTALVASLALVPLLYGADAPGKEILHPVAVVIFGGLVSSTTLDTIVTPVMFHRWGRKPLERLLAQRQTEAY